MNNIGIHCFVSGRVQGVWFRAETQKKAKELGLAGWARNLCDGRVEVMAFGAKEKLDVLESWLHHGPSSAQVENLSVEVIDYENHSNFAVRK